jgi:hypothetical protein
LLQDPEIAKEISQIMLGINERLENSVAIVRANCSSEESKTFGVAVGRIVMMVFDRILDPIYWEHPSLKPPGLE